MQMNQMAAIAVGFDSNRGILHLIDGHPSCGGSSDDTRITTRCDAHDPLDSFYTTVHEAGHALYGQNLPLAWRYQPAGNHLGMAVHESQSMIIQLQACMSEEFFVFLSEHLQKTFNRVGDPALDNKNLQALMWRATPSFIRVSADELTYPAHILLRHDLEKRLIEKTLDIADLPEAWNDGMKQRLGITPPDHAQGCMQDVHWPTGSIGYFPAYTLGAMGAAQFFDAAKKAEPDLLPALRIGDFTRLKDWLVRNVHAKGSLVDSQSLFKEATGAPLNARAGGFFKEGL
jgi:carboxypeptidase Taq